MDVIEISRDLSFSALKAPLQRAPLCGTNNKPHMKEIEKMNKRGIVIRKDTLSGLTSKASTWLDQLGILSCS